MTMRFRKKFDFTNGNKQLVLTDLLFDQDIIEIISAIIGGGGGGGVTPSQLQAVIDDLDDETTARVALAAVVAGKLQADQNLADLVDAAAAKVALGLDQVDNTPDGEKPMTDEVALAFSLTAAFDHVHDDRYYRADQTNAIYRWTTGDPEPWFVSLGRPANLMAEVFINEGDTVPSWVVSGDIVWEHPAAAATAPVIRSFGTYTPMSANGSSTECQIPVDIQDGDRLWLMLASTGAEPTTPAGWSAEPDLVHFNAGGDTTNGLKVVSRLVGSGEAATLAGATVTVALTTSTSAVAAVVCWVGDVTVESSTQHSDATNTVATQTFGAHTPGADLCKVLGISALRYNTVAGGSAVGPHTGWSELFDYATTKAGAPDRGLLCTVLDVDGENGVEVAASSATTTDVVRTCDYTVSVVKAA